MKAEESKRIDRAHGNGNEGNRGWEARSPRDEQLWYSDAAGDEKKENDSAAEPRETLDRSIDWMQSSEGAVQCSAVVQSTPVVAAAEMRAEG